TQLPAHDELKRAVVPLVNLKPSALYRPSTMTPGEVAAQNGFQCERTALRNVSLDQHDFDVASKPYLIDSAGYLGTFSNERTAIARLRGDVSDGYIYYVAPTPNMLDVNASLGSRSRVPEHFEIAAMGRIGYTQIRGWR